MARNHFAGESDLAAGTSGARISFWQTLENLAGSERGVSHSAEFAGTFAFGPVDGSLACVAAAA